MFSGNLSISNFLLQALEPPPEEHIHQSINLLKRMNALDSNENVTYLGAHLTQMPVDCEFGKMLLYSIVLRCIDPVVTIVSILSSREPFVLPRKNNGGNINHIKNEFSENSLSDHKMVLNTFKAWFRSTKRDEFCAQHLISNGNMKMVQNMRRLINRHLDTARYTSDRSRLNENSLKWEVVKACLVAGLYREFF